MNVKVSGPYPIGDGGQFPMYKESPEVQISLQRINTEPKDSVINPPNISRHQFLRDHPPLLVSRADFVWTRSKAIFV